MKITCQSCQSKYNVADEKVQGKVVKIRCRKCGATIVVQGTGGASANGSAASAEAPAGGDSTPWHVNLGENDQRTMTMSELVDAYNTGVVTTDTFLWNDGMEDWKPLAEVEVVVLALHAASGSPASTARPEADLAPASELPAALAPSYEAPVAAQAAAAQPPSEQRRAAVVKREARSGRDLFGGGVGGEEVQTSAPSLPHSIQSSAQDVDSKLTGERNENSVLFSLAMLTKEAEERPADAGSATPEDDSGLIDLKALTIKPDSTRPAPPPSFGSPLAVASPFGLPLGTHDAPGGEDAKSKLPMLIGGGALVALLVLGALWVGMKFGSSQAPVPAPAPVVVEQPGAAAAASAAAAAAAASASASAAAASASASASASAKPKAPVWHPQPGAAKPAGVAAKPAGAADTGGAPAATPAPKKASGCEAACNGDLMCLMKCSAAGK